MKSPASRSPAGYREFLDDLKTRIRTAQVKAALAVNRELIRLYWDIGGMIAERQKTEGWGRSVVERLAADIRHEFPGVSGFSVQNIWKMRAFYLAWTDHARNVSQAVREKTGEANLSRLVREMDGCNLPQAVAEIPWGHNTELLFKLKDPLQRLYYAHKAIEHGWSRSVLMHWIESDLYSREGRATTNFPAKRKEDAEELARKLDLPLAQTYKADANRR